MTRVVLEVDVNGEELFFVDKVPSLALFLLPPPPPPPPPPPWIKPLRSLLALL
jgi:hypothetical protein